MRGEFPSLRPAAILYWSKDGRETIARIAPLPISMTTAHALTAPDESSACSVIRWISLSIVSATPVRLLPTVEILML